MKTDKDRLYLGVAEIATIFGVNEATVRIWATNGELGARKIGQQWFFPKAVVSEQQSINDARKILGGGISAFTTSYDLLVDGLKVEIKSSNLRIGREMGTYWTFRGFHPANLSDFYLLLGYDPERIKLLCAIKIPSTVLEEYLPNIVTGGRIHKLEDKYKSDLDGVHFNVNTKDEFFYPYIIYTDENFNK